MTDDELRLERRAFRTAYDDGLWDVLIACVEHGGAPEVAERVAQQGGDCKHRHVPLWVAAYLGIRLLRNRLVIPRVGEFRQRRLRWLSLVLLAINVVALLAGLLAYAQGPAGGWVSVIVFWLIVLAVFSVAAYFLDTPRLLVYGLMLATAVAIGEWLFQEGYAADHGYPIVFGVATIVIAGVGLVRFGRMYMRTKRAASTDVGEPYGR